MKIGIDIGGSHIGIALLDKEGSIAQKKEIDMIPEFKTPKGIVEYLDKKIEELTKENNIELVGIACPGNPKGEKATNLVNLGVEVLDFTPLSEKYKIPFLVKNDSKAAGMAEMKYGALRGCKDAIFLCIGTGIGSAVFLNGRLLTANKNLGFELGHIIIQKDGLQCNCGKKGCFETYCSIKRFKEKVGQILCLENITSEQLLEKLKENLTKTEVENVIDEYIENLIVGLSNLIDIFEPEVICLGGSFVFFKDIFYDKLVTKMNTKKYVFNKESLPKIVLAKLKNNAGMIGAAI